MDFDFHVSGRNNQTPFLHLFSIPELRLSEQTLTTNNQAGLDLARNMSELYDQHPANKEKFNTSPPRKIRRETYPIDANTPSDWSYPNNLPQEVNDRLTSTPQGRFRHKILFQAWKS